MKQILSANETSWINIDTPDIEELAAFVRDTQLEPIDAEFVAQKHQRPEITIRKNYILLLLKIPTFDKKLRITLGISLYIVITKNRLWTLHYEPIMPLQRIIQDFTDSPAKQEEYFSTPLQLGLHVINQLNISAFKKMDRLSKHIEITTDAVFHGNERKMVEELAILIRDVTDFRSILRPQQKLFEHIPTHELIDDEAAIQWQRINNQMQRLWEMLDGLYENVREVGKTNASLIQHKENELLRLLTWYSIITIPFLVFISPFTPNGDKSTPLNNVIYWGTLVLLIIILLVIFLRFRHKKVL